MIQSCCHLATENGHFSSLAKTAIAISTIVAIGLTVTGALGVTGIIGGGLTQTAFIAIGSIGVGLCMIGLIAAVVSHIRQKHVDPLIELAKSSGKSDEFTQKIRGLTIEELNKTDRDGKTLLYHAAEAGNLDKVKFLLTQSGEITKSACAKTPLDAAIERNHIEVAVALATLADADAVQHQNADGWTPLHTLAQFGTMEMVEAIESVVNLAQSFRIIPTDAKKGSTSIPHIALKNASEEVAVKIINIYPGNIDLKDTTGATPLIICAQKNKQLAAQALLAKKASIKETDSIRKTPLHYAASYGHLEMVELLLATEKTEDVIDARDWRNRTPLFEAVFIAVRYQHDEFVNIVKILILAGADIHADYEAVIINNKVEILPGKIWPNLAKDKPELQAKMLNWQKEYNESKINRYSLIGCQ